MRCDTVDNIGNIRADSPTTHKDSLKLALVVAEGNNLHTCRRFANDGERLFHGKCAKKIVQNVQILKSGRDQV